MFTYKGKKYHREDDFLVAYYSDMIKLNPSSPLFVPLADIYLKNNRLNLALQTCQTGLEKMPNYDSAHYLLAQIHHALGESMKAIAELEPLIARKPNNIAAIRLLAEISMGMNDYRKAQELLKHLIDLNPNDKNALNTLAKLPLTESHPQVHHAKEISPDERITLPENLRETIRSGNEIMSGGKAVPSVEAEIGEDDLLLPDLETPEEEIADSFEEPSPEPTEFPKEVMASESQLEEADDLIEINEPPFPDEPFNEFDEESLPPLPGTSDSMSSDKDFADDDFSASLITDERAFKDIGRIFDGEYQDAESKGKTEHIVRNKEKVINNLEGWLKKLG